MPVVLRLWSLRAIESRDNVACAAAFRPSIRDSIYWNGLNGYRFWFYSADLDEPPHVHVGKSGTWFFPMMWEQGQDQAPVEFLDDKNIIAA